MCSHSLSPILRSAWERRTKWALSFILGISLAAAGCDGSSTATITGKVYYNDAPLKGGNVSFMTKDQKVIRLSEISEDGSYTIEKMPTGEALITVETSGLKPPAQKMPANKPPPGVEPPAGYKPLDFEERAKRYVPIPDRYSDPKQSGLTYQVQKGKQQHDIKLTK
jgi:hypothetical protein